MSLLLQLACLQMLRGCVSGVTSLFPFSPRHMGAVGAMSPRLQEHPSVSDSLVFSGWGFRAVTCLYPSMADNFASPWAGPGRCRGGAWSILESQPQEGSWQLLSWGCWGSLQHLECRPPAPGFEQLPPWILASWRALALWAAWQSALWCCLPTLPVRRGQEASRAPAGVPTHLPPFLLR